MATATRCSSSRGRCRLLAGVSRDLRRFPGFQVSVTRDWASAEGLSNISALEPPLASMGKCLGALLAAGVPGPVVWSTIAFFHDVIAKASDLRQAPAPSPPAEKSVMDTLLALAAGPVAPAPVRVDDESISFGVLPSDLAFSDRAPAILAALYEFTRSPQLKSQWSIPEYSTALSPGETQSLALKAGANLILAFYRILFREANLPPPSAAYDSCTQFFHRRVVD